MRPTTQVHRGDPYSEAWGIQRQEAEVEATMRKTLAIALVALSTVSATTAALSAPVGNLRLQSGPLMLIPGGPVIGYQFRCGTVGPVEFPSGVQLWNGAQFATPAGLKV